MSKVFIAWSGNFEFAKKLKNYIDSHPAYDAIVGGNLHELSSIFVGGTIIEQMKKCDQAILLIQKNSDTGRLSSNLMFEWGYMLAKLNANKIHIYFMNLSVNDTELPSDLHGVWAYSVNTVGREEDDVVRELGEKFFSSQRNSLSANKMAVIIDRENTRGIIKKHFETPACSSYEIAQYILCYIFSANIYRDTCEEALKDIETFSKCMDTNASESPELTVSVRCALVSIDFFKKVKYVDDEQYITKADFYDIREKYEALLEQAEDDLPESEIKQLIIISALDYIGYLYLLIMNGDELSEDKKLEYCHREYDVCLRAVKECDTFEKLSPIQNKQLSWLIRSYMYRNIYCSLDCIFKLEKSLGVAREQSGGNASADEEGFTRTASVEQLNESVKLSLYKSFEERKKLYNEYSINRPNELFFGNIEMEYFLAMAEYRLYEEDKQKRNRYYDKLSRYVSQMDIIAAKKKVFTEKIRGYIKDGRD